MSHIIFHIDVNSAFLSWTSLDLLTRGETLDLRSIPSIIGGDREKRHGVVLAKSLPARSFGIRTGEPIVSALRKCPNLVIKPPDHPSYEAHSKEFRSFLESVCPDVEQVSIDECYMDYTPIAARFPSPEAGAAYIKDEIYRRFGFTVNVGISDRKVLAKMASDFKKPNLVHTLYVREIKDKMWPLPVSALFMCGKSSVDTLRKLEINTIGDLARADVSILTSHLKSHGRLLWEYANGIDDTSVIIEPVQAKGIGNSITLKKDAVTREEAFQALLSLSESVSSRLRESAQTAGMVSTEIKYATFRCVSHQTLLEPASSTSNVIFRTACRLFDEIWDGSPVRLLGVRTSRLMENDEPVQLSLFDFAVSDSPSGSSFSLSAKPPSDKQRRLDQAIDQIRQKYGKEAVVRGSLLSHMDDYKKH